MRAGHDATESQLESPWPPLGDVDVGLDSSGFPQGTWSSRLAYDCSGKGVGVDMSTV